MTKPLTQPLALVYYRNLLPGSQLVNRLEDLGYRVQTVAQTSALAAAAKNEKPLLALVDLSVHAPDVCAAIAELRADAATSHLPVLAFTSSPDEKLMDTGRQAGATLVCGSTALLAHLPQLLEQALQVE